MQHRRFVLIHGLRPYRLPYSRWIIALEAFQLGNMDSTRYAAVQAAGLFTGRLVSQLAVLLLI